MVSYTLASLSLIGIPPFAGFVSKWSLATQAVATLPALGVVGAATLLVSAILTAGYLLSITIDAFFYSGENTAPLHPTWRMLLPVGALAVALLVLGLFPGLVAVSMPG
jgi:multicomponent Na+:H+ antiporter subunit D